MSARVACSSLSKSVQSVEHQALIAQQPVDLLGGMLGRQAPSLGQPLADGVDGERGRVHDAEHATGERQYALGVQVVGEASGDEGVNVLGLDLGGLGQASWAGGTRGRGGQGEGSAGEGNDGRRGGRPPGAVDHGRGMASAASKRSSTPVKQRPFQIAKNGSSNEGNPQPAPW